MPETADVVIIGGGVWGLSTAYHLSLRQNLRVTLVERNTDLATETTKQAAGQIGQLRSDQLMMDAVGYTLSLLNSFESDTGYNPEFVCTGSLHLAQNRERLDAFRAQMPFAQRHGISVSLPTPDEIKALAPAINLDAIEGALFVQHDGYVNAHAWANALAKSAVDRGVTIKLNADVKEIQLASSRVVAVRTNTETISTDRVVVACGPWTKQLASTLNISLPVVPIRLQQTRTCPDPNLPTHHPVVRIPDQSCYLRPENGGYLYGFFDPDPLAYGEPQHTTSDIDITANLHRESTGRLSPLFPILNSLDVAEHRRGMVTCTPDANYVVGPAPQTDGLFLATGCGAMGIAGSGAVGRWLANWVSDGDPGDDLSKLSPSRFDGHHQDHSKLIEQCRDVFANYYALKSATYNMASPK